MLFFKSKFKGTKGKNKPKIQNPKEKMQKEVYLFNQLINIQDFRGKDTKLLKLAINYLSDQIERYRLNGELSIKQARLVTQTLLNDFRIKDKDTLILAILYSGLNENRSKPNFNDITVLFGKKITETIRPLLEKPKAAIGDEKSRHIRMRRIVSVIDKNKNLFLIVALDLYFLSLNIEKIYTNSEKLEKDKIKKRIKEIVPVMRYVLSNLDSKFNKNKIEKIQNAYKQAIPILKKIAYPNQYSG